MSAIRRKFFVLICLFAAAMCGAKELWETLPETGDPVKDFAGLLPAPTATALTVTLRDFHDKTGASLVVVTVPSLEGGEIADFSNRLFNRWGVGDKATNRGVMLVIAKADRKMRIECGYGAEPIVPDAVAKGIILDDLTPAFKQGRFADGIVAGSRSIMARFGYDAPGAPPMNQPSSTSIGDFLNTWGFWVLLVFGITLHLLGRRFGWISTGSSGGWGGGWGGGGGSSGGGFSARRRFVRRWRRFRRLVISFH